MIKLNNYTGIGYKIYSHLMVQITQILHLPHHSSVFLDVFKKVPDLDLLFVLLTFEHEFIVRKIKLGNDDEHLAIIMNHKG